MKRIVILILVGFTMISAVGVFWLNRPYVRINNLNSRYMATTRGMTIDEVVNVMGENPSPTTGAGAWWDDDRLGGDQDAMVSSAIYYKVDTFFLPVTFEFTFDGSGKLLGRHRFD